MICQIYELLIFRYSNLSIFSKFSIFKLFVLFAQMDEIVATAVHFLTLLINEAMKVFSIVVSLQWDVLHFRINFDFQLIHQIFTREFCAGNIQPRANLANLKYW